MVDLSEGIPRAYRWLLRIEMLHVKTQKDKEWMGKIRESSHREV